MATGRYKLGPQGAYYDPNDQGPDQASPEQIQALQGTSAPAPAPAPPAGWTPTGGVTGGYQNSGYSPPASETNIQPDATTSGSGDFSGPIDQSSMYYKGGSQTFDESAPGGITAPGTPYGNQPGSQDTGIVNPGSLGSPVSTTAPTAAAQTSSAVPAGFDATKWNDPNKSDPKYDIGHLVANGADNTAVSALLAQKYPGWTVIGKDIIQDPQGNQFDFRNSASATGGIGTPQWTLTNDVSGGGAAGGVGGAPGTAGAGAGVSGGINGSPTSSAFSDQVRQLLLGQLGSVSGPVTAQDPQIKAEMDAQDAALTRTQRDQRSAAAERAAMNGLLNGGQSSGSFDQELASEAENKGQQLTGIQAQLFGREIQSRRDQVARLLQQAMASGDAESTRNLQYTLAQLDNAYRYYSLNQQQGQFNDTFGLQASQDIYNRNKDLALYGAGY